MGPELDRRSLLIAGAGVVTSSALLTFDQAEAGTSVTQTFSGSFTSPDTPDWHYLPFEVPRHVRSIRVKYDFHPHDTGLGFSQNVVDIGIFDPSGKGLGNAAGFRGWSGGARRTFRIGRHWATRGYLAGAITPGRWHIILGPFMIVPPGTPWKVEVTLHFGDREEPKFVSSHAPTRVPGTGPGWYRGDLHLHTVNSDGRWTQPWLLAEARARGLDFLGTSEHNTNAATRTWGRYVPEDFLVVSGEEVTTRSGHWLAMGIPPGTWIDWRYRDPDHLGHFADLVRSLGGVAIAAHPWVPLPGTGWGFGFDFAHVDAIEIWNAEWSLDDEIGVQAWQQMLVDGTWLPVVGNSDSHHDGQTVGLAQSVYRLATLSTAEVVAAVKGGHCWVAESSAVDLTFTATLGDTVGECGDTVPTGPADLVGVHLEVTGVPGCVAQLWGASGVLAGALADGDGRIVLDAQVPGSERFVRAEVRRPQAPPPDPTTDQSAAPMVALTNPVLLAAG